MKKILILSFVIIILFALSTSFAKEIKIMTYNIKYDDPKDYNIGCGWNERKQNLAGLLLYHAPEIIGLQEPLLNQLLFLDSMLVKYSRVGVGRDDGKEKGEFAAIYYLKENFDLIKHGNFWLSQTPQIPGSIGWDAALTRIVTWAKLKFKRNGKEFYVFNTHFDHKGTKAREESAKLLISRIDELLKNEINSHIPVIITGDFNCLPASIPYSIITEKFFDTFELSKTGNYGPNGTGWGFLVCESKIDNRIDYIFVSKGIEVLNNAILTDSFNQRYPSDHLPVISTIKLE